MLLKNFFKLINRDLIREIINLYRKSREIEERGEEKSKGLEHDDKKFKQNHKTHKVEISGGPFLSGLCSGTVSAGCCCC